MSDLIPKIGTGVMIFKDGKVLLGKRISSFGNGAYQFPGGHLEHLEFFASVAKRETLEETGMEIKNIRLLYLGNFIVFAPKHYIQVAFIADWASGEPTNMEPDKCESWDWYDLNDLPSPILPMGKISFHALKTGQNYFDQKEIDTILNQ
jgi:8-oxo-dGTP diphosphatase